MLLAADCGNTNIVFAVYDGNELKGQWCAATKTDRTSDEYGIWLTQLMAHDHIDPMGVTHAIVAQWCRARTTTSSASARNILVASLFLSVTRVWT